MKKWLMTGVLLALWTPLLWAQLGAEEELLPPEQAFAFSAEAGDADTITAHWDIAEGYYLYRSRIRFSSETDGITLGAADFPPGKIKQDEFFGEVETYRHGLSIPVPLVRETGAPDRITLVAVSQGCADIGVCYPPQTHRVELDLPAAASAGNALQALSDLGKRLGLNRDDDFLPPEQAFVFSGELTPDGHLEARWDIAEGYYLYREKIDFQLPPDAGARFGEPAFPPGEVKDDEFFGRMEVYHGGPDALEVSAPLLREGTAPLDTIATVTYQGCAEAGICYPPQTQTVAIRLVAGDDAAGSAAPAAKPVADAPVSEQDRIAQRLTEGNVPLTLLTFFGFGLLLAFTPCVFPMIPILSSIIVGQGEKITTRRAFVLSLTYVLAMALTYTVAGVIAGLFGENLQAAFQDPWILGGFATVFVLLSLSMFGFYDLQIPQSLQSRLAALSNRQQGGTLIGVGIMGMLSALIVGPCVAAPLAAALIVIGQTGDPVLGGMALFALSLGMGAPLVLIGTGAGKFLPRAGDWMNIIKGVFGVLLLAVAIWMLERIIPASVSLALWGLLLVISSIYLGALDSLGPDATGWKRFWKGSGLAMLLYGAMLLVGAAAGSGDMTQPLRGVVGGGAMMAGTEQEHADFTRIKSLDDLEREVANAAREGKPALLDFYADWCVDCRKLEKYTFSDPAVQQALADTVLLQADVTANDATDKALLKHFGLIGPPSILFFGPDGGEKNQYRLVGFLNPEEFTAHLEQLPFNADE